MKKFIKNFLNFPKLNLIKEALTGRPWNYGYLRELEKAKLMEMRSYFQQVDIADKDRVLKWINLAITMLEILEHEERLFHFTGRAKFTGNRFDSSSLKYHCDVKVNLTNMSRFTNNKSVRITPHELYLIKAKHLYHLIREYYEESWGD